jgi:hypothetical protein
MKRSEDFRHGGYGASAVYDHLQTYRFRHDRYLLHNPHQYFGPIMPNLHWHHPHQQE